MNHDDVVKLLSAHQWMDIEFIKKVQQTEQVIEQVTEQVAHQVKRLLINMDKEMTQPDSPKSPTQKYRLTITGQALHNALQK